MRLSKRVNSLVSGVAAFAMTAALLGTPSFAAALAGPDTGATAGTTQESESAAKFTVNDAAATETTITAAINAATADSIVVKLNADMAEDVVVPAGKVVTIDLNGRKLTNVSSHTIVNHGTLTLTDSSEGHAGVVDVLRHGKGALYNDAGASVEVSNVHLDRSLENGKTGTNSWYTIKNYGTMKLVNTVVTQGNPAEATSSVIANGWYATSNAGKSEPRLDKGDAHLTIESGSFSGGLNTIKNDEHGVLEINGGTFTNNTQWPIMNWNVATINNGIFNSNVVSIWNSSNNTQNAVGKLTINGGTFNGKASILWSSGEDVNVGGTVTLNGGTYNGVIHTPLGYKFSLRISESTYNANKSVFDNPKNGGVIVKKADGYYGYVKDVPPAVQSDVNASVPEETTSTLKGEALKLVENLPSSVTNKIDEVTSSKLALTVNALPESKTGDKASLDNAVEQMGQNASAVQYLDINLALKLEGKKNGMAASPVEIPQTELSEPISITIPITDAAHVLANKVVRVLRLHNGQVSVLPTTVDRTAGTVTFSSDKFSSFAVVTDQNANVSFDTQGGSAVDSQAVAFGEKAQRPAADPTRDGYTFAGWYTEATDGEVFNFDTTTINADTTIYAHWTQNPEAQPGDNTTTNPKPSANQGSQPKPVVKANAKPGALPKTSDIAFGLFSLVALAGGAAAITAAKLSRKKH